MKAKLYEVRKFQKLIDSLKEIVKSLIFTANKQGIILKQIDITQTVSMQIDLPKIEFLEYSCNQNIVFEIKTDILSKILNCSNIYDTLTLQKNDEQDQLKIIFESQDKQKFCDFDINLLEFSNEQFDIQKIQHKNIITMNSLEFSRICNQLSYSSQVVQIEINEQFVKFQIMDDLGIGCITLKAYQDQENNKQCILQCEKPIKQSFSLRYLNLLNKVATLSNYIVLHLTENQPLLIEFQIEKLGIINYHLAPQISDI